MIETVPFAELPNAQCGDWRRGEDGTIHIRVAKEIGDDSAVLVILHEYVEMTLCEKRGISCAVVDTFDAAFEARRQPGDVSEDGDAPDCPYRREHFAATNFERLMASEMAVDWRRHENRILALP
jgi:hypothetical protein